MSQETGIKTLVYKRAGKTSLYVDVYIPFGIKLGEEEPY